MSKDNRVVYSYRKFEVPPNVNRSCPNGGVARVAFRVERPAKDYSGKEFKYTVSFAFCSPLDNFSRRGARALTTARACFASDSNDVHARDFVHVVKSSDRLRIAEIVDDTIYLMGRGDIHSPNWMRDAVELGLDED